MLVINQPYLSNRKLSGMDAHIAESYFMEQHGICCHALDRYARRANSDHLHRLRVSIKKLKAILTILAEVHDFDMEAHYAPYRYVFQQAGAIREASIIRDRLLLLSSDRKAITHRTRLITGMSRKLQAEAPLHLRDIYELLPDTLAALRAYEYDMPAYCSDLSSKLRKRWRQTSPDSNYHSLRKHLKQMLYCAPLLLPSEQKKICSAGHLKKIDKLQDLIGRWHDVVSISSHILTDVKDRDEVNKALGRETKKLRKKITTMGDSIWR